MYRFATLTRYDDQELTLILDFIERSNAAASVALAELRGETKADEPTKSARAGKSSRAAKRGKSVPTAFKSA